LAQKSFWVCIRDKTGHPKTSFWVSEFSTQFRNGDIKLPKPWQDMKTTSFPSVVGEGLTPAMRIFAAHHK